MRKQDKKMSLSSHRIFMECRGKKIPQQASDSSFTLNDYPASTKALHACFLLFKNESFKDLCRYQIGIQCDIRAAYTGYSSIT